MTRRCPPLLGWPRDRVLLVHSAPRGSAICGAYPSTLRWPRRPMLHTTIDRNVTCKRCLTFMAEHVEGLLRLGGLWHCFCGYSWDVRRPRC